MNSPRASENAPIKVRGPRWGKVPEAMLIDRELQASDKVVLAYLCTFMNREREAWPTLKRIASCVESERTAVRAVKRLRDARWVKTTRHGREAQEYEIAVEKGVFLSSLELPLVATQESPDLPRAAADDLPFGVAIRSTDHTSTNQVLAPADAVATGPSEIAVRKTRITRQDVVEAAELSTRLVGWFEKQYRRPHWAISARDKMALAQVVSEVRRLLAKHPKLGMTSPTEVIVKAIDVAIRDKASVFPLNKGEDLTLRVLTQHWHRFFDNVMKAAQDAGEFPPAHDVDLHQVPV